MAGVTGRGDVSRFIGSIPEALRTRILRGAGREAAGVVADEARLRSISPEVTAAIKVTTKLEGDRVIARVIVKGNGAYIAPWLEYGTALHYISVDDSQRGGMSVNRINKSLKAGSLVINGKPVGKTVFHPGARPNPFLRPALDTKEAEAIAKAQSYITARLARSGLAATPDDRDD